MTYKEALRTIPFIRHSYGSNNLTRGSYTASEWFSTVKKALEKQIPKKTTQRAYGIYYYCPECGALYTGADYCCNCGQRLER